MTDGPRPLELLLVTVAGWVSRRQQRIIEPLLEENLSVNPFFRAVLAIADLALGVVTLAGIAFLVFAVIAQPGAGDV